MATIGNISLMLKLSAGGFVAGMRKVNKVVNNFAGDAAKMSGKVAGIGAAMAGAAAVGLAVYAKRAIAAATGTTQLARSVNASVAGLTSLQQQIRSLGGDEADAVKAFSRLNDVFGDLGPDGQQARDAIERLGLNFDKLRKMSADQQFAAIAEKVGAIADPGERAAVSVALFRDEAEKLLPALTQGKQGLSAAQNAAEALGLSFGNLDASKVEDANIRFGQLSDLVKGVSTQFAVQLAPWIISIADELSKLGVSGVTVGKTMGEAFRFVAKSVAYVVEYGKKAGILIVVGIQGSFTRLIQAVSMGLEKLFSLAAKLPEAMGGSKFKGLAEDAKRFAAAAEESIKQLKKEGLEQFNAANYTQQVDAFFDSVVSGAEAAGKALDRMNQKGAKGALANAIQNKKLFGAEAARIKLETLTPLQKFEKTRDMLIAIQKESKGAALTAEQFARAMGQAVTELESAHQLGEVHLAGGLRRESSEALSAINNQDALVTQRLRETPQQKLERLQQQSVAIEQQQLEYLKRLASAAEKQPQLVPMP